MSDELDEFLDAAPEKSPLNKTLEGMDNDHFMKVAQAVNSEYLKRVDSAIKPSEMTDGEFFAYKQRHGI